VNEPLSNPLRRSLADGTPQGPHPEADLLTAFAEGSLTRRERESVLAHLSTCAHCREVLGVAADAAPQVEVQAAPQLVARPVRPPLRSWLPWVSTAAAVVVVGSAVLVHELPRRRGMEAEPPAATVYKNAAPAQADKKADSSSAEATSSAALTSNTAPPSAAAAGHLKDSPKKAEEKSMGALSAARTDRDARAVPPPPPPVVSSPLAVEAKKEKATEQITVQSQSVEVQVADANKAADLKLQSQMRDLPVTGRSVSGTTQNQRGGLGTSNAVQQTPSQQNARQNRNESADQYANARVSQAAPPTRSAETQQNVAAAPAPAFVAPAPAAMRKTAGVASEVVSMPRPHWRIDDNGRLQRSFGDARWQAVLATEASRFRVVSVIGAEVWAGGDNSRLYHSIDNGTSWTAVRLPVKDKSQHSITSIHFQTPQSGIISSEDGTTWTTGDGGKSWK
jgi:hypothetical protein